MSEPTIRQLVEDFSIDTINTATTFNRDTFIQQNHDLVDRFCKNLYRVLSDQVIEEGEVHYSHVCPPDNIGCAKFAARGAMRNAQRQRLLDLVAKEIHVPGTTDDPVAPEYKDARWGRDR